MINQKGQSLVEAVIALGVVTIIISAMAIAVVSAVNNSDYSKYENQATHFAQQGIEILKQLSQSNWYDFSTNKLGHAWCLGDPDPTTNSFSLTDSSNCVLDASTTPNVGSNFIRQVDLTNSVNVACGTDSVYGKVTVYWNDGKCLKSKAYCHSVELNTCFANIDLVPTL